MFLDFNGMSGESSENFVRLIRPVRDSRKIRPEKEILGKASYLFNDVFQSHTL